LAKGGKRTVRTLLPLDAPRVVGGHNRAYPIDALTGRLKPTLSLAEVARLSIPRRRKNTSSLVMIEGRQLVGMASGSMRSDPAAWELTHLLLAEEDSLRWNALSDDLCHRAACVGGHRMFVRLRAEEPLVVQALSSGFIRCSAQILFENTGKEIAPPGVHSVRQRSPADDYGLYRLYSTTTPAEVRAATAMTLPQWRSSRERVRGGREYVTDQDGRVVQWLRVVRRGDLTLAEAMYENGPGSAGELVDQGLILAKGSARVLFLVGAHQVELQASLSGRGFEAREDFVTLARAMVATAREGVRRRAVTVASI